MIDNSIKFPPLTQLSYCCPIPPNMNSRTLLYENKPLSTPLFPSLLNSQFLIRQNNGPIPHFPTLFGNQLNYNRNPPFFSPRFSFDYDRQEFINQLNAIRNKYLNSSFLNSILGLNNINNLNEIINNNQLQSVLNKISENKEAEEIENLFNLDKKTLVYFNDIETKDKKKLVKPNINKNVNGKNSLYNLNINIGYDLQNENESLQNQINSLSNIKKNGRIENKNTFIENNILQKINQNQTTINEKNTENNLLSSSTTTEKSSNSENEEESKNERFFFKNDDKISRKETNFKDQIHTKLFICKYPDCGKSFNQSENLKKHEKLHNNNKYICSFPNCGKKFTSENNLKNHFCCHKSERPYKCNFPNCGKSFNDKGNLKYHEKIAHTTENEKNQYSNDGSICSDKFENKKEDLDQNCGDEIECFNFGERKELIKLIQKYKNLLIEIILNKKVDDEKDEKVLLLKKKLEDIKEKLIDNGMLDHNENLEEKCDNLSNNEILENEL